MSDVEGSNRHRNQITPLRSGQKHSRLASRANMAVSSSERMRATNMHTMCPCSSAMLQPPACPLAPPRPAATAVARAAPPLATLATVVVLKAPLVLSGSQPSHGVRTTAAMLAAASSVATTASVPSSLAKRSRILAAAAVWLAPPRRMKRASPLALAPPAPAMAFALVASAHGRRAAVR